MKRKVINFLWLLVMFSILNGLFLLCSGQTMGHSIIGFLICLALGLVIDFNLKKYTGETWWTMKDIINKLKQR